MSNEAAEIYLRQFAEAQLRLLAAGAATAADCASRVDAVAVAFTQTGLLEDAVADAIAGELEIALAVRSPERGIPLHRGRRAPVSTFRIFGSGGVVALATNAPPTRSVTAGSRSGTSPRWTASGGTGTDPEREEPPPATVVPVGKVLRVREDGADEDIYLLTYVAARGRAWLSVAARTSGTPVSRPHASSTAVRGPGTRRGWPSTFAGRGLTAAGSDGQRYTLAFSGGGSIWYLGQLRLSPEPPPGLEWLDISCGGQTVRADLTARSPEAVARIHRTAAGSAETYLLQRAETLLGHPPLAAAEAAGMASVVPALRAVGALPEASPVPGQLAALLQRLGADGNAVAVPGELPERWAGALAARGAEGPPAGGKRGAAQAPLWGVEGGGSPLGNTVTAAHLTAVLPQVDGVTITLAGLLTRPDEGTTIFGAMSPRPDPDVRVGGPSLWLADDSGWHTVEVSGWSSSGDGYTFKADVVPPLTPDVTEVEFHVVGLGTEVRVTLPLTWWES